MPIRSAPSFDQPAREAAASVLHIPAELIFVEVDEVNLSGDGKPSILIRWRDSMRVPEKWGAVRAAVYRVLPESYRDYHLSIA